MQLGDVTVAEILKSNWFVHDTINSAALGVYVPTGLLMSFGTFLCSCSARRSNDQPLHEKCHLVSLIKELICCIGVPKQLGSAALAVPVILCAVEVAFTKVVLAQFGVSTHSQFCPKGLLELSGRNGR